MCIDFASTERGQLEAPSLKLFWSLPCAPSSADFSLDSFAVIDQNHESHGFSDFCVS